MALGGQYADLYNSQGLQFRRRELIAAGRYRESPSRPENAAQKIGGLMTPRRPEWCGTSSRYPDATTETWGVPYVRRYAAPADGWDAVGDEPVIVTFGRGWPVQGLGGVTVCPVGRRSCRRAGGDFGPASLDGVGYRIHL